MTHPFSILCLSTLLFGSLNALAQPTTKKTTTTEQKTQIEVEAEAEKVSESTEASVTASSSSVADHHHPFVIKKFEQLEAEIEALKNKKPEVVQTNSGHKYDQKLSFQRFSGYGAAASKIYFNEAPWSLGASAEVLTFSERRGYDSSAQENRLNQSNILNVSPIFGYKLSEYFLFNSKLTFENGGMAANPSANGDPGQVLVELAYLDVFFNEDMSHGLRLGHQYLPVGLSNLLSEPIYYYGVQRPELETELLPENWHENGALFFGGVDFFHYKIGVFDSLYFKSPSSALGSEFIDQAKQNGRQAATEDLLGAARIDFVTAFLQIGGSYLYGDTAQDQNGLDKNTLTLWDVHLQSQWRFIAINAVYTEARLGEAGALNALNTNTEDNVFGDKAKGYYVTLAVDLLQAIAPQINQSLPIFYRYSDYNLHDRVPGGNVSNKALNRQRATLGINYRPIANVTFKMDYQWRKNKSSQEDDVVRFGVGLIL